MEQANMYMGVLWEKKLNDGVYRQGSAGYLIFVIDALSRHQIGVVVFYKDPPQLTLEVYQNYGPNVMRFHLEWGGWRWCIVVCYLAP